MKSFVVCLLFIYKDSRLLEEYEIVKEVLEITSSRNKSRASVKIVFRRRVEYHITKTYLQVFITVITLNIYILFNPLFLDFCSSYGWILVFLF